MMSPQYYRPYLSQLEVFQNTWICLSCKQENQAIFFQQFADETAQKIANIITINLLLHFYPKQRARETAITQAISLASD